MYPGLSLDGILFPVTGSFCAWGWKKWFIFNINILHRAALNAPTMQDASKRTEDESYCAVKLTVPHTPLWGSIRACQVKISCADTKRWIRLPVSPGRTFVHTTCFSRMTHTAACVRSAPFVRLLNFKPVFLHRHREKRGKKGFWGVYPAPALSLVVFPIQQWGWTESASPACCHICSALALWLAFLLQRASPNPLVLLYHHLPTIYSTLSNIHDFVFSCPDTISPRNNIYNKYFFVILIPFIATEIMMIEMHNYASTPFQRPMDFEFLRIKVKWMKLTLWWSATNH